MSTDSFFDLGKNLPQIANIDLQQRLATNDEVFEHAFVPSSLLEAATPGDTIQFKEKIFKRMRFYETHFRHVVFTNCCFDECLFLSAHFEDCAFHECKFIRCNTHKFNLTRTYIDPRSFLGQIFDRKKYSNVGVDLFHTLLKNSVNESQPEFRDTAEYYFRLWQRYNKAHYWACSKGWSRWLNVTFYMYWILNVFFQKLLGYGVRVRNIIFWTPVLFFSVWAYNQTHWDSFGIDQAKLASIPLFEKTAFFTIGNLSTFGTADLTPTTPIGLLAVACQVIIGITWIAVSTAMIVKRFVR